MRSRTTTKTANDRLKQRVIEAFRKHGPVTKKAIVGLCERYVPPESAARYAESKQSPRSSGPAVKIRRLIRELLQYGRIVQSDPGGKNGPLFVLADEQPSPQHKDRTNEN